MAKSRINKFHYGLILGFICVSALAAYVPFAITSGGTKERIESACVGGNSTCTADCASSPCTISRNSSAWITLTRSTTGAYQGTFAAGTFSATPVCWGQAMNGDYLPLRFDSSTLTSTLIDIILKASTGSAADGRFSIACMGPR
jgi:hypothetical protein